MDKFKGFAVLLMAYLLLPLAPMQLFSQEKYDFVKEAAYNAAVYRGVEADKYYFRYQGTPYAYSERFEEGTLIYNDVEYRGLLLNLNAHKDQLHLKVSLQGKIIELDRSLVESFTIGARRYVSLMGEMAVAGLEEGFYEVLFSGKDMLVKKNVRKYFERIQTTENGSYRFFDAVNRYYAIKGGVPFQVSKPKDFGKIYKEDKKRIKGYIRKNRVRFIEMDDKERTFGEIMSFIHNN